ncbi:MAG: transcriptional regulator [Gemmatimonadetes bacterium]|nr:transcriptional regulator [Gemmatimonadota bacterium]
MDTRDRRSQIEGIATLGEPVRGQLYFFVAGRGAEVSRDQAARHLGISRALAAFHLDKLVEDGLLEASFRRLSGRRGPGAGRPAKLYRRSDRELAVSIPARQYELAAQLLAEALLRPGAATALPEVAREFGAALGAERARPSDPPAAGAGRAAMTVLRNCGYEPYRTDDGAIRMRNCPFHALAARHRDMVCSMNEALLTGLVAGMGLEGFRAELDPRPGECCVTLRPRDPACP